ncbi:MAG TPA: ATP-dependent helicase [Mucilaginibacter sp.]|jgi:superfamily I DNA/RNA helicase|nr:ATP-dependent helicase [Mucilaginibacter sp.]
MAWNDNLDENTPAYRLASSNSPVVRAVAGPGSGKSFAIKRHVARLLETGIQPERILAITFTRTAAQDLKREISSLGIDGADQVHSRTIHSHALKILMKGEVLQSTGRTTRMVIDHELGPALRDIDDAEFGNLDNKKELRDEYLAAWASLQTDEPGFVRTEVQRNFENKLVEWLKNHNGILVGEVIPVAIEYLRNNPASPHRNSYDVILVDEYQDLNRSEQEFIRLIRGNANIVIVGDDDQSIYGFKYAHPEGIKDIGQLHGDFEDIEFSQCRRCPQQVTRMASQLISINTNRTLGDLNPYLRNSQGIVQIIQWATYQNEINGIVHIIAAELERGIIQPQDILILTPRRKIGYLLKNKLLAAGFNAKSYFRESLINSESVKRAYSLLNYLANPEDLISIRYLLGHGSQDFRKNQYDRLIQAAGERQIGVKALLDNLLEGKERISGITTIVKQYEALITDLSALKTKIIESPLEAFQSFFVKSKEDEEDFYELGQIYKAAVAEIEDADLTTDEGYSKWLHSFFNTFQELIVMPEIPENIDHIRIMSLHASKGLSAKLVIMPSMIDNLMPFVRPELTSDQQAAMIEEQRRLFYVAITRCKSSEEFDGRLIISSFLSIRGVEAARMGIPANPKPDLRTRSTRFLREFGTTAPNPVPGETLI